MTKISFIKQDKELYTPPAEFVRVSVPPMRFLAIDGRGDPNVSPDYTAAVQALYGGSYALKMTLKKEPDGQDWGVGPLEGLWWSDDETQFARTAKAEWNWTMMIRQPDFLSEDRVREILAAATIKKKQPAIGQLRFESFEEGECVQIMHIGSYDDEAPTIARLHQEYLPAAGLRERGKHHEIYLNDPRRTDVSRLKTILRQPVTPISA